MQLLDTLAPFLCRQVQTYRDVSDKLKRLFKTSNRKDHQQAVLWLHRWGVRGRALRFWRDGQLGGDRVVRGSSAVRA